MHRSRLHASRRPHRQSFVDHLPLFPVILGISGLHRQAVCCQRCRDGSRVGRRGARSAREHLRNADIIIRRRVHHCCLRPSHVSASLPGLQAAS